MISWERMEQSLGAVQKYGGQKRVCIGFDGYIDTLYRVVKTRKDRENFEIFSTISEFADRVEKAAGRSADMELKSVSRRMGGNAPLMAEAMGCQGIGVRCIGTMGYPEPDELFSEKRVHFSVESVGSCAESIAFEFSDGKLMFGNTEPLLNLDWNNIVEIPGLDKLRTWYRSCDLWSMVNWSFLLSSNDILEGLLRDVIEPCPGGEKKLFFFDLADPSSRSREDLSRLFSLMGKLNAANRVVLSMNENESVQAANALDLPGEDLGAPDRAAAIREKLGIWMVSIHGMDFAVAATEEKSVREEGIYVADPRISTGGGDHFNGGFAAALVCGLSPGEAMAYGNLVSSCYVSSGSSPTVQDLHTYLKVCRE